MNTSKGRNMPGEAPANSKMPVRPAEGGYGATAAEVARGYIRIPNIDVDSRTGPFPDRGILRRNIDGI